MAISKAVIRRADSGPVLGKYSDFADRTAGDWLRAGHPAKYGTLPSKWSAVRRLAPQDVVDAIAVSTPNHCIDGWTYLARSMSAVLCGDYHSARHLAYYAQLRAGLGVLGSLGVGVFNGINFIVNARGGIERLDPSTSRNDVERGLGTHAVVWDALAIWVDEPMAATAFLNALRVRGNRLLDIVEAIFPGASSRAIASDIIDLLGVDLRRGKEEHRSRNISSYNPQALNPLMQDTPGALRYIDQTWRLYDPTSVSRFDLLDRHIVRRVLWKLHRSLGQGVAYDQGAIARRYDELPQAIRDIASLEFLTGRSERIEPALFQFATQRQDPAGALDMLSRAFILLRLATAFVGSGFVDAGIAAGSGKLDPWLMELASKRGFLDQNQQGAQDFTDLWYDVDLALQELKASATPDPGSLKAWLAKRPGGTPTISQAERIGIWSLGG